MQHLYCDTKDKVSPPATATETCSMASEMTGNDALVGEFVEQEESSIMESQKKESPEWTNEKHSLYLKSIEASFIDQLYNSLDMQSCQTQKTISSNANSNRKNHANTCTPSGQFKVLQGGCWSKKNFRRESSQPKNADKSHVSSGNPWIKHFRNGSRERSLSTATLQQYPVDDHQLHQESGGSNTEVTDQNFVEETSIERTDRSNNRKRMRTSTDAHSNNDQVVPFCTSPATEIGDSYVSPKK